MIDLQTKQMADDFARRIAQQGLTVEQYFQFTGLSEEKMMEEMEPQAEKKNPHKTGSRSDRESGEYRSDRRTSGRRTAEDGRRLPDGS